MSGSQQELCHSNGDHGQCSNYYSTNSNNKKVGSLWYSRMLDSLLDECEEKYGLRNAHPGYQMSQGAHHHHQDANADYGDESSLSTSCPESYESISNKIKKQHDSFRKVAKLLRNLQAEMKEGRNPKDSDDSNGNDSRLLNDAKPGAKPSCPATEWRFSRTRNATDIPVTPEGDNKDGCYSNTNSQKNMTTTSTSCKSQPTAIIPSMCPKGNKAEEETPTARESSIDASKSKMTGESVKNSSNSTNISPTVVSSLGVQDKVKLTGEDSGTFPVTPPSYSNNSHEIKHYSQVPVDEESQKHKMSSSLLQELLGKPHNLNVKGDRSSSNKSVKKDLPEVSVTQEQNNLHHSNQPPNYEEDEVDEDFFSLFITLLGYSTSALKRLLSISEIDEETKLKICESAKEAQFQIGTLYGDPCVMGLGGQLEMFRSNN